MFSKIITTFMIALVVRVNCSGLIPAPAGIAYTRAIPLNIPPFAAAVSFLRTGPVPAFLPPHLHLHGRYSPLVPHLHAAPAVAPVAPFVYPGVLPHAHAAVPLAIPHAVPHPHAVPLGIPNVHAHAYPHTHGINLAAPHHAHGVPLSVPHAHGVNLAVPHGHDHGVPLAVPHAHAHGHLAPVAPVAPAVVPHHVQALPHLHGPARFAPLVAAPHGYVDPLHYHHR